MIVSSLLNDYSEIPRAGIILVATVTLGVAWRLLGKPVWHWFLQSCGVHRDDGIHAGWDALVQTRKAVSQATIYTRDGMGFHLADRERYEDAPWQGLYLGSDGSVTMIVEEETNKGGKEETRTAIQDADFGVRYTYFPADQIQQVELRMK